MHELSMQDRSPEDQQITEEITDNRVENRNESNNSNGRNVSIIVQELQRELARPYMQAIIIFIIILYMYFEQFIHVYVVLKNMCCIKVCATEYKCFDEFLLIEATPAVARQLGNLLPLYIFIAELEAVAGP